MKLHMNRIYQIRIEMRPATAGFMRHLTRVKLKSYKITFRKLFSKFVFDHDIQYYSGTQNRSIRALSLPATQ
jgi:hypothetical protein